MNRKTLNVSNFFAKLAGLLLTAAALAGYQTAALQWAQAAQANEQAVAAADAYNRQVTALEQAQNDAEQESLYLDGVYQGSGTGFGGEIVVSVTVEGGEIVSVEALSHDGEDDAYFSLAQSMLPEMTARQTWAVDSVSGATFSSSGLLEAAENAIRQAVKP
jgi:uncharacterized protein with FMN-binding domain